MHTQTVLWKLVLFCHIGADLSLVGNDYIRGVSGGERKRVRFVPFLALVIFSCSVFLTCSIFYSIAEMVRKLTPFPLKYLGHSKICIVARAPIAAWDNSTRGLDSASALEFVKSLQITASLGGSCSLASTYQASQAIYDIFDKVIVLYEGREIYFGPCNHAEQYFSNMGWYNPPRQTTGDFLTSVTNPQERRPREGMENKVPRTCEEFERYWKSSPEYAALQREIEEYETEYPIGGRGQKEVESVKRSQQAKHVRPRSPYIISLPMQIKLCMKRGYQRYKVTTA